MVDITPKLEQIKTMVDNGQYFTINRARQYGKTTTLRALERFLEKDYLIISLDFQMLSYADFESESSFVEAFTQEILDAIELKGDIAEEVIDKLYQFANGEVKKVRLANLFRFLSSWCEQSPKPIVLMIDEVDSATNNQVFLDFLSQLRGYYIKRDVKSTFQSVILAGVYDVKNIKRKIRSEDTHKENSPWNIAADFLVDMSFSVKDIEGMLLEYESDYHTGMDIHLMSKLIYDYTGGYPFLVSRICKILDERMNRETSWTKDGFLEAVKILLLEKNTLFESLSNKIMDYSELRTILYTLLFTGKKIPYNSLNKTIEISQMFGFVKNEEGSVVISNRIFETILYNLFLSEELLNSDVYKISSK
jgi:hypothetical protein